MVDIIEVKLVVVEDGEAFAKAKHELDVDDPDELTATAAIKAAKINATTEGTH